MASYQTPEFAQSSTRQNDWIDYRRDDGELLGWICPHDDDFIAIDRLGRLTTGVVDWLEAEEALEAIGLGYLADTFDLDQPNDEPMRVKILEVGTDRITVKEESFGVTIGPPISLPFPAPPELKQWS